MPCVNYLIESVKWFFLISNCNPLLVVSPPLEYSQGQGKCFHRQQCLASRYQPCHWKWSTNPPLKPNMVNQKIQHHWSFVILIKVTLKLAVPYIFIPHIHWQRSIAILPTLSNAHIGLRCKTRHLRNMHAKRCKHCLHHYFYKPSFQPMLSTPSSWYCETADSPDTYSLSIYLGEWTV